jgi:2-polyprenyl-3-methyl-5-hydroxy-6-metoxy-1,4-benzoquinol methylase
MNQTLLCEGTTSLSTSCRQRSFDLVHTRWVLHHLPHPERVISRLQAALRPGGWILIEEGDFFPVRASTSQLYIDFMVALVNTVVLRRAQQVVQGGERAQCSISDVAQR